MSHRELTSTLLQFKLKLRQPQKFCWVQFIHQIITDLKKFLQFSCLQCMQLFLQMQVLPPFIFLFFSKFFILSFIRLVIHEYLNFTIQYFYFGLDALIVIGLSLIYIDLQCTLQVQDRIVKIFQVKIEESQFLINLTYLTRRAPILLFIEFYGIFHHIDCCLSFSLSSVQ